ncbi:MAG: hypothetical protein [Microviridae sp.]|nr:MAG: hypothetical protein [Microviridae sp.]
MMSNSLIFLILLIKGLSNETPQNVIQIKQTVIHSRCESDPQKKPHGEPDEGRDSALKNAVLSPANGLQESDNQQERQTLPDL